MAEVRAEVRGLPISAQKIRLVIDEVRGKDAEQALDILNFMPKKGARFVGKLIASAIANAENNHGLDMDSLYVKEASVGKALVIKRFHPRARGRSGRVEKPFSHLTIVVREREETA